MSRKPLKRQLKIYHFDYLLSVRLFGVFSVYWWSRNPTFAWAFVGWELAGGFDKVIVIWRVFRLFSETVRCRSESLWDRQHFIVRRYRQQINAFLVHLKSFICYQYSVDISFVLIFHWWVDFQLFSVAHFVQVIKVYVTDWRLTIATIISVVSWLE